MPEILIGEHASRYERLERSDVPRAPALTVAMITNICVYAVIPASLLMTIATVGLRKIEIHNDNAFQAYAKITVNFQRQV